MTFQDVEMARQAYAKKLKTIGLTIVGVSLILIIASMTTGGDPVGTLIMLLPIVLVVLAVALLFMNFINRKEANAYRQAYKSYFVEQNLQNVFTDLSYIHEMGISKQDIAATDMVNTGSRYSANDFASGKYKDVSFSQSDVHIETEYTDSDGNTHYVTIFKGRFMIFEFPKQFNFRLGLAGKRFRAYKKPSKTRSTGRKMDKISTESGEFNKAFRVFGEDGFEAYYILDPAFMVKLMDISTRYKHATIFYFLNNQLIIGLDSGKDSFEPPFPFKPIDEAKENAKVSTDIKTITDFVEQLSLDRKLFKA